MSIPRINLFRPTSRKSLKFAVVVIGLLGLTLFDWDEWGSEKHKEQRIALAQLPGPVKAAVEREAQLGTLNENGKTIVGGKIPYAASVVVNGKEQETRIGEDGQVISRSAARGRR